MNKQISNGMSVENKMKTDLQETRNKINNRLKNIKYKFVVLSNKGGVGKTAISTLFAHILDTMGKKVGLLDADVHGPSTVKALGMENMRLKAGSDNEIFPLEKGNIKLISIGLMLESDDKPVIWRGPMKSNLIKQFLSDVVWGELDYLIVDSPPGTGDEPMSILQLIENIDGGIVVTTPQEIALLDSRKCVNFLKALNVPVLGIIENMSGLVCPHCGSEIEIFKKGGGRNVANELGVPFLGRVQFDPEIVRTMDSGLNFVLEFPDSEATKILIEITKSLGK